MRNSDLCDHSEDFDDNDVTQKYDSMVLNNIVENKSDLENILNYKEASIYLEVNTHYRLQVLFSNMNPRFIRKEQTSPLPTHPGTDQF